MIRVLLVEDIFPILRRYRNICEKAEGIEVCAAVSTGKEAVQMARARHPDVILMDIEMETKRAGLDAARMILKEFPQTKIIILTVYEDDALVFEAFELGVCDYILKNAKPAEIVRSISDAYHNLSPIRPIIAEKIRREFQRIKKKESSLAHYLHILSQLTPTEIDILNLIYKGYSRTDICEIRCVELSTVKTQIHSILKKFNLNSMSEVIRELKQEDALDYLQTLLQPHP